MHRRYRRLTARTVRAFAVLAPLMAPRSFAVTSPPAPPVGCAACAEVRLEHFAYEQSPARRATRFPLRWRLGNVDPRFKVSESRVRRLTEDVIRVWEDAAGRRLFVYDASRGFPVSLVFDHRQEREIAIQQAKSEITALAGALDETERALSPLRDEFNARQEALNVATRAYNRRLQDYNRQVDEWNRQGGAPSDVVDTLEAERRALGRERNRLAAEEREVDDLRSKANAKVQEYNDLLRRNRAAVAQFNQRFGKTRTVQLGQCIRTTQSVKSVTIYCFRDEKQLAFVLAHEMGHAIGLQHVKGQDSIMVAVEEGERSNEAVELSNADRKELARALRD